jgi:hypothetical protein
MEYRNFFEIQKLQLYPRTPVQRGREWEGRKKGRWNGKGRKGRGMGGE